MTKTSDNAEQIKYPDVSKEKAEQKKEHYDWIDLARTIAILSVVLCHVTEASCRQFNLDLLAGIAPSARLFLCVCFTVGRTAGVPVFLMLTGYILLDRKYSSSDYAVFLKNRCLHLFVCTWIWYAIYEAFVIFVRHIPLTPVQIAEDFLFVHPIHLGHAWYMPMILGIYLLLPLVANALHSIDTRLLIIPVIIYIFYSFGFSFLSSAVHLLLGQELELGFSPGFSGGVYGIYVFMGYAVRKGAFRRLKTPLLVLLFILSVASAGIMQYMIFSYGKVYKLRYDFPTVLIGSVVLAELLSRLPKVRFADIFRFLAYHAFGVYLIHLMIVRVIENRIVFQNIPMFLKVGLLWTATIGLSYPAVWLIGRIPKVGKYILYEK